MYVKFSPRRGSLDLATAALALPIAARGEGNAAMPVGTLRNSALFLTPVG
jgi:hypothetical protein